MMAPCSIPAKEEEGLVPMMASCSIPAKEAEGESVMGPNWLELPTEVTTNILQRLSIIEIATSACQVCSQWRNICNDPFMWRTIDMDNSCNTGFGCFHLFKTCCYAVVRSCGLVEDINIEYFGTNDLLKFIVERASGLRRIRLAKSLLISDEGLMTVATRLAQLEEIDISYTMLTKDSLKVIGRCCPLLKSLKFSRKFCVGYKSNAEAFAIAKTMPKLCHLHIFGNVLTDVGLLAILDGCPLLQSLDMRYCFNLDLAGSLRKRCLEQIKDLQLPSDSVDDDGECIYVDDDFQDGDVYSDNPSDDEN